MFSHLWHRRSPRHRRLVQEVEDDTTGGLGRRFPAVSEEHGFRLVDEFGDGGAVTACVGWRRTMTFVRWRWHGYHVAPDDVRKEQDEPNDRRDRRTGNPVTVEGLTVLESRPDGVYARRFVDWASVYGQLGLAFNGRPVGMANTVLVELADLVTPPDDDHRRGPAEPVGKVGPLAG